MVVHLEGIGVRGEIPILVNEIVECMLDLKTYTGITCSCDVSSDLKRTHRLEGEQLRLS